METSMSRFRRFFFVAFLFVGLLLPHSVTAESKENDVHKAKDSVNQALSHFADGVHEALHGANKSGNTALQNFSDSVHRFWAKLTGPSTKK